MPRAELTLHDSKSSTTGLKATIAKPDISALPVHQKRTRIVAKVSLSSQLRYFYRHHVLNLRSTVLFYWALEIENNLPVLLCSIPPSLASGYISVPIRFPRL
jgi:hypothetical protein